MFEWYMERQVVVALVDATAVARGRWSFRWLGDGDPLVVEEVTEETGDASEEANHVAMGAMSFLRQSILFSLCTS